MNPGERDEMPRTLGISGLRCSNAAQLIMLA